MSIELCDTHIQILLFRIFGADTAVSKLTLNYWRIQFLSDTTENEIVLCVYTGCVMMLSAADDLPLTEVLEL